MSLSSTVPWLRKFPVEMGAVEIALFVANKDEAVFKFGDPDLKQMVFLSPGTY